MDPNKKRTDTWLQTLRLQLPAGVTKYGSIGMVTYVEKDVNGKISFDNKKTAKTAAQIAFEKAQQKATNNSISEKANNDTKFSLKDTTNESDSQTKSEAFKDWFGDWEKHPNTASKVVNEDGTPRVMYHGTKRENFTVFDSSKSDKKVKLNVLGNGYYFSSEMSGAERYGNNVMSVYLDIKKPYQVYGRDGGIEAQYQQYTMWVKKDSMPNGKVISMIGSKADILSTNSISPKTENVNKKFSIKPSNVVCAKM